MGESGHRLGLPLETREDVRIIREASGKDLDGDVAIEPGVPGAVDLAHAAGAKGLDDLVGPESGTTAQYHGGQWYLRGTTLHVAQRHRFAQRGQRIARGHE